MSGEDVGDFAASSEIHSPEVDLSEFGGGGASPSVLVWPVLGGEAFLVLLFALTIGRRQTSCVGVKGVRFLRVEEADYVNSAIACLGLLGPDGVPSQIRAVDRSCPWSTAPARLWTVLRPTCLDECFLSFLARLAITSANIFLLVGAARLLSEQTCARSPH